MIYLFLKVKKFFPSFFIVINKDELVLVDFEVVGVGSGPQDIGQYMISHLTPEKRKKNEMELLRK